MILELFFIIFGTSIVLTAMGLYFRFEPFTLVGCMLLFLSGLAILTGSVDYEVGKSILIINSTNTQVTNDYASYQDQRIGYFLASLGLFSFIYVLYSLRRNKKNEKNNMEDDDE